MFKVFDKYFISLGVPDTWRATVESVWNAAYASALVDASKVNECAEFEEYYLKEYGIKFPADDEELRKFQYTDFLTQSRLKLWNAAYAAGQKSKALVLPETCNREYFPLSYGDGWDACLKEIKRMNEGSK